MRTANQGSRATSASGAWLSTLSRLGELGIVNVVLIFDFNNLDVDIFFAVAIDEGFLRLLDAILVLKLRDDAFLVHFLLTIEVHGPVLDFDQQPRFLVE